MSLPLFKPDKATRLRAVRDRDWVSMVWVGIVRLTGSDL